jgi:hypothetical protein
MEQVRLRSNGVPASPEQVLQWRGVVVEQEVERLKCLLSCTELFEKAFLAWVCVWSLGKGRHESICIELLEIPRHCVVISDHTQRSCWKR